MATVSLASSKAKLRASSTLRSPAAASSTIHPRAGCRTGHLPDSCADRDELVLRRATSPATWRILPSGVASTTSLARTRRRELEADGIDMGVALIIDHDVVPWLGGDCGQVRMRDR
jgi:hypothetical protein